MDELTKHSHSLNNISDKLYTIVTGNMLQRKSISQIHFIGEWIKAHCIANFTCGFRKTIWDLVNAFKVMLTAGQAWQVADPHISIKKPGATNHLLVIMNTFAREVKISIGTHTRSGSTMMINTPWHAKIEAQELFYFIIVPVGGTLIDLAVSMKVRHRCPWNFDIWQLRWMLSQEPWENPSCGGGVPLVTTWNYRCYCFAEKRSWKTRLNGSFLEVGVIWKSGITLLYFLGILVQKLHFPLLLIS